MVGWHHQLNGHEFEQTPGIGEGQGSLVCCSPWGHKARCDLATKQQQIKGIYRKKSTAKILIKIRKKNINFHSAL